jgi:uncharacterized Zn-binding protein involved in type VI secretion
MPKAARKGDKGRHDKEDLTAVQGSPNVFINGQPAVRVGDVYQSEAHPASSGSATVNINGKPAVRVGDMLAGHAVASTGSPNVFIGDSSYGAAKGNARPVYEILLSQVPGSADPAHVYDNYPYKLYHNGRLVQQGRTDGQGIIAYEYEPPLKGTMRVEMASGDSFDVELQGFAPSETRRGIIQRMKALGYFHLDPEETDQDTALVEANVISLEKQVSGVTDGLANFIKAKMP